MAVILTGGAYVLTRKNHNERSREISQFFDAISRSVDQASTYAVQNLPIGIAIIGSLLGSNALAGGSITGATGTAANYANLLLVAAGTALLGLIVFFVFKKKIYEGNHALETEESAK